MAPREGIGNGLHRSALRTPVSAVCSEGACAGYEQCDVVVVVGAVPQGIQRADLFGLGHRPVNGFAHLRCAPGARETRRRQGIRQPSRFSVRRCLYHQKPPSAAVTTAATPTTARSGAPKSEPPVEEAAGEAVPGAPENADDGVLLGPDAPDVSAPGAPGVRDALEAVGLAAAGSTSRDARKPSCPESSGRHLGCPTPWLPPSWSLSWGGAGAETGGGGPQGRIGCTACAAVSSWLR